MSKGKVFLIHNVEQKTDGVREDEMKHARY